MERADNKRAFSRQQRTKPLILKPLGLACAVVFVLTLAVRALELRSRWSLSSLLPRYDTFERYVAGGWYDGSYPEPSPEGRWLIYSSPRSGRGDIYLASLDGSAPPRQIADSPDCELNPTFSPDGKYIAYLRQVTSGIYCYSQVWLTDITGTTQHRLLGGLIDFDSVRFIGDDHHLLVTFTQPRFGQRSLFAGLKEGTIIVSLDGLLVRRISSDPIPDLIPSPDGKKFYYSKYDQRETRQDTGRTDTTVWVCDNNLQSQRRLCVGASPAPSPDGKRIAYVSNPWSQTLWVMDADGSHQKQIYTNQRHYLSHPVFLPDSGHIIFHEVLDQGVGDVVVIGADGSSPKIVAKTG